MFLKIKKKELISKYLPKSFEFLDSSLQTRNCKTIERDLLIYSNKTQFRDVDFMVITIKQKLINFLGNILKNSLKNLYNNREKKNIRKKII